MEIVVLIPGYTEKRFNRRELKVCCCCR